MVDKHMFYFNLMNALKEEGCGVCFVVKDAAYRFMDNLLYERTNDPYLRKEVKDSLGFCPLHAWQLQGLGDCLSSTIIYSDLMNSLANGIKTAEDKRHFLARFSKIKNRGSHENKRITCPVCKITRETEKNCITLFVDSFSEPEFHSAYKKSFGLCLPHLTTVINNCSDSRIVHSILDIEHEKMKDLVKELDEIKRKYDYRFSDEDFGKDGNAWIRAVEKVSGKEGAF